MQGLGAGAGLGTGAGAGVAGFPTGNADLRVFAMRRFFQRHFHRIAQVVATKHLAAPARTAPATAKNVAKNVAKRLAKATKTFGAAAAHIGVYAGMAVLVVRRPFLRVRQHLVSLFQFFEFGFGFLGVVTLIAVRVVFHRQFAIRLFDVFV